MCLFFFRVNRTFSDISSMLSYLIVRWLYLTTPIKIMTLLYFFFLIDHYYYYYCHWLYNSELCESWPNFPWKKWKKQNKTKTNSRQNTQTCTDVFVLNVKCFTSACERSKCSKQICPLTCCTAVLFHSFIHLFPVAVQWSFTTSRWSSSTMESLRIWSRAWRCVCARACGSSGFSMTVLLLLWFVYCFFFFYFWSMWLMSSFGRPVEVTSQLPQTTWLTTTL